MIIVKFLGISSGLSIIVLFSPPTGRKSYFLYSPIILVIRIHGVSLIIAVWESTLKINGI